MSEPGHAEVMAAIDTVLDPCSVFNGTRLSLIELGMVERVTIEDGGRVHILLFLDDPTCMLSFEINRMLDEAVSALPGVTKVSVEIKADELWTEDRMTRNGRTRLEAFRAKRRQLREVEA